MNRYFEFSNLLFVLLLASYFWFGTRHLGQFMTIDEPKWLKTRSDQYFDALRDQRWEDTYVNNKPGVLPILITAIPHQLLDWRDFDHDNIDQFLFYWRLPIVLFNGIILILIYYWLRKLIGNPEAIFVTGLIAFFPQLIGISQIMNPDSTCWGTMFLAFLTFLHYLRETSRGSLLACGIFFGLALISKFSSTLLYPGFFCLFYLDYLSNDRDLSSFLKRLSGLGIIYLISMAVYFVALPACWTDPMLLLKGTILSGRILPAMIPFTMLAVLLIGEATYFKGRFIKYLGRSHDLTGVILTILAGYMLIGFLSIMVNEAGQNFLFDWSEYKTFYSRSRVPFFPSLLVNHFVNYLVLSAPVLLGTVVFLIGKVSGFSKGQGSGLLEVSALVLIVSFIVGSSFTGIHMTPRYQVVLFPFFCFLCAGIPGLLPWAKWWTIIFLLVTSGAEVWRVKPFYLQYTNQLNVHKLPLQGSWGFGGYEIAKHLNANPNAEEWTVWTEDLGFSTFFKGTTEMKTFYRYQSPPDFFLFRGMIDLELNRQVVRDQLQPRLRQQLRFSDDPVIFNIFSIYSSKHPVVSLNIGHTQWNLVPTNPDDFKITDSSSKLDTRQPVNLSKPFSIEFWILPNDLSPGAPLSFGHGSEDLMKIEYGIPRTFGEIQWKLLDVDLYSGMISVDRWHHIAFCHSPKSGTYLLVDGIVKDSASFEENPDQDQTIWLHDFEGVMEDFRVYNRALTTEQVLWLASNSSAQPGENDKQSPFPLPVYQTNAFKSLELEAINPNEDPGPEL